MAICAEISWEVTLNVGLDVHVGLEKNKDEAEEVKSTKAHKTNYEIAL